MGNSFYDSFKIKIEIFAKQCYIGTVEGKGFKAKQDLVQFYISKLRCYTFAILAGYYNFDCIEKQINTIDLPLIIMSCNNISKANNISSGQGHVPQS